MARLQENRTGGRRPDGVNEFTANIGSPGGENRPDIAARACDRTITPGHPTRSSLRIWTKSPARARQKHIPPDNPDACKLTSYSPASFLSSTRTDPSRASERTARYPSPLPYQKVGGVLGAVRTNVAFTLYVAPLLAA